MNKKENFSIFSLGFSLLFTLLGCHQNLDTLAKKGLGIARSECHQCHAPMRQLSAPPMDRMYKKLGEKGLNNFLLKEFNQKKITFEEHQNIFLSKSEVKHIKSYLKVLGGDLLPY